MDAVFDIYNNELGGRDAIVFAMLGEAPSGRSRSNWFGYELHIVSFGDNVSLFKINDADGQLVPLGVLRPEEAKTIAKEIESIEKYKTRVYKYLR